MFQSKSNKIESCMDIFSYTQWDSVFLIFTVFVYFIAPPGRKQTSLTGWRVGNFIPRPEAPAKIFLEKGEDRRISDEL